MESELSRAVGALPGFVWTVFPDGQIEFLNQRWCAYTGLPVEQSRGAGWQAAIHPEDLPALLASWQPAGATDAPADAQARVRSAAGDYRWFQFRAEASTGASGQVTQWCGLSTDIDVLKRTEALLAGEKQLLEMVARRRPMSDILESLCQFVERAASGSYCSLVLADASGTKLKEAIAPSLAPAFNEAVRDWPLDRVGGPCVVAARDQTQVIMSDVVSDTRWRNSWRALAQAHGLRSCWSTPIVTQAGKVLGTFALYQREPGRPNEAQLELIRQLANIASIAIERAQSDAALRESQAKLAEAERELQLTMDSIPVLVSAFRPDGTRTFVNQGWKNYTGLALQDVVDKGEVGLHPNWHPDDVAIVKDKIKASLASGEPYPFEGRLRNANGDYRWHFSRGVPLRDETGGIIRWYSTSFDIHDRRIAEEELRRSETLFAEGQRLSSTGTFAWLTETNRVTFSPELHRIFEFAPDDFLTLGKLRERTHPEDRVVMDMKVGAVRDGHDSPAYKIRLQMPDGRIKYIHIMGRLFRRQDGRLECIGAIQDVTQHRLAEEALDKVRSEFAHVTRAMSLGALTASIAHEVNQPLAGIVTNASTCLRMLAADPPNIDGARETARRTIRDGNRAADVIARLRALFVKKGVTNETLDLNETTREVLSLVSSDLLRNGVSVRVDIDDTRPLVITGDRVQLQQVILNLLRNASDAMSALDDRTRSLLVSIAAGEDGDVRVSVKDAGVGLEPRVAERIFDPFYTTKVDGMGIGLSVSRSIIEGHGGRLWVERNDGPGATFSFSIPRQETSDGVRSDAWTLPTTDAPDPMRNA
ncbi:MAG: hypothetical protein V7604_4388 [Hyphomicrobiales bacterium]